MVVKDTAIEIIVKQVREEQPGYMSVVFERPANFVFEAGDWIDIAFDGMQLSGGKTYSLSSSPTEQNIVITFRVGMSELKRRLQQAAVGETLTITQYGNDYGFQLKMNQSSVLIAGGVGIAPFRSMTKQMFDEGAKNGVQLIYLNQNEDFLFRAELDEWAGKLPNLVIEYISTKALNRKKREKLILSLIKNSNQNFYISGPPGMVEANEHLLIDNGVAVRDIRIDSFGGY